MVKPPPPPVGAVPRLVAASFGRDRAWGARDMAGPRRGGDQPGVFVRANQKKTTWATMVRPMPR
jgi:hypothetical protein